MIKDKKRCQPRQSGHNTQPGSGRKRHICSRQSRAWYFPLSKRQV